MVWRLRPRLGRGSLPVQFRPKMLFSEVIRLLARDKALRDGFG